jgi:transposase-like protein
MDPQSVFCPNLACPARGQSGQGNITIHSQREQRYRCTVCRKTFSARRGTPFYRTQYDEELITLVVTLIAHGCPEAAAVVAFGLHPRTIQHWVTAAGEHAERVQQHLVEQPRDLGQVQADEIRVKAQGAVWWMAMAMQVSTRLWLGGRVGPQRDRALIRQLADLVARCAVIAPLLLVVDGLMSYIGAFQRACRERVARPGKRAGWRAWPAVAIGQVVKQYARRHVVGIERRVVQGTDEEVTALLARTQGGGVLNTSFIERLNGTFRSRLARLGRRTRAGARQIGALQARMYLVGTVYNFCTPHASLQTADGHRRTPAQAAGLTEVCWAVERLLHYQVPPGRWVPPKQRGRRSKQTQELIQRWAA